MWRCPKCGSTRLEQFRNPYGPMWCKDCYFLIKDKTITPNPFYVEKDNQGDVKQEKSDQSGLGEQLAAQHKKKKP